MAQCFDDSGVEATTEQSILCDIAFSMTYLGMIRTILGMEINRERSSMRLWLSEDKSTLEVLQGSSMDRPKKSYMHLAPHFKLNIRKCISVEAGEKKICKRRCMP